MRIRNLLNSPVDVQTSNGPVVLGPREERDVDGLHPSYEPHYRASSFFEVEDGEMQSDDLAKLRADYAALVGKKPFHGWDADELRRRIDEVPAE